MTGPATLLLAEIVALAGILTFLYLVGRRIQRARRHLVEPAFYKPRVRIVARGNWIRHGGDGFPFDRSTPCEVIFEGGGLTDSRPLPADYWPEEWWKHQAADHRYNIMFYRFVTPRSVRDMPLTELPA